MTTLLMNTIRHSEKPLLPINEIMLPGICVNTGKKMGDIISDIRCPKKTEFR
jgi:hypothetical protein